MEAHFALTFFGALFAIMNPFTNLPVFLTVTDGVPVETQRKIAFKTGLYCLILGSVFAVAGQQVLNFFGISVDDFRVAGGLVVLLIALNMVNGRDSSAHHGSDQEKTELPAPETVAFFPLTFPILVGPGTMTTLILFSQKADSPANMMAYGAVFASVIAILVGVFWAAPMLGRHLSSTMRIIMSRLMGMILAAIAISMITEGLKVLLPGLG